MAQKVIMLGRACDTLLHLGEELLNLFLDEFLNILSKLLNLARHLAGSTTDLLAGAHKELSELIGIKLWEGDGDGLFLDALARGVTTLFDDRAVIGGSATVPGEDVLGVAGNISQSTLGRDGDEVGLQLLGGNVGNSISRVLGRLQREQVGQKTGNMGRGHGGTGDGVDGVFVADPGGLDVQAGSKDVIALSVVGEVCAGVIKS